MDELYAMRALRWGGLRDLFSNDNDDRRDNGTTD